MNNKSVLFLTFTSLNIDLGNSLNKLKINFNFTIIFTLRCRIRGGGGDPVYFFPEILRPQPLLIWTHSLSIH